MLKVAGIDHIVLRTVNPDVMLEFYAGILNCEVERQTSAEIGLTQLRAGAALIDLVAVDSVLGKAGGGAPTRTENNVDHFCLQLCNESEDEIRDYLESRGVEVAEFVERYGARGLGRSVYVKDPDGNTVELSLAR